MSETVSVNSKENDDDKLGSYSGWLGWNRVLRPWKANFTLSHLYSEGLHYRWCQLVNQFVCNEPVGTPNFTVLTGWLTVFSVQLLLFLLFSSYRLLCCSIAILKYLVQKHQSTVADHWYPADLQQRARVNEYLSWQHMNLRTHGSKVFLLRVSVPD